jgi:hypothetical protein
MRNHRRSTTTAALLVLAAVLVLGASLLTAGSDAAPALGAAEGAQRAPGSATPLPNFEPSEVLSADAAVAFPTDI